MGMPCASTSQDVEDVIKAAVLSDIILFLLR